MPASPPAHSSLAGSAAPSEVHRKLQDKVLQSAEDAVLAQAASPGAGEFPTSQTSPTATQALLAQVKRYVAAQPCQSALLAAATGALVMMFVRAQLHQRIASRKRARTR